MQKRRAVSASVGIALTLAMVFLPGCISTERVTPPSTMSGSGITISMGTVGRVGGLSIGLGSISREDYVDTSGNTRNHLVAGLACLIEGNPPTEHRLGIYAGQTARVGEYVLFAEEISKGLTGGHVTLIVQSPSRGVSGGGTVTPAPPDVSGNWHGILTSNHRDSVTGKPVQWANYTMRLEQNGFRVTGTIYFSDISNPKTFEGAVGSDGHLSFMFGVQGSRSISVDCTVQGDSMSGVYYGGGGYSGEYYSPGTWQGTRS